MATPKAALALGLVLAELATNARSVRRTLPPGGADRPLTNRKSIRSHLMLPAAHAGRQLLAKPWTEAGLRDALMMLLS